MDKKPLIGVSILAVVLLVLGSSVPAVARTQSSLSETWPPISPSSAENYKVYIGALYSGGILMTQHSLIRVSFCAIVILFLGSLSNIAGLHSISSSVNESSNRDILTSEQLEYWRLWTQSGMTQYEDIRSFNLWTPKPQTHQTPRATLPCSIKLNNPYCRKYPMTTTEAGKTLYVGGKGPENYSTIWGAVYDASDGDTVFVYSGIYRERLIPTGITIHKSINLIGENKETTIIDGKKIKQKGFLGFIAPVIDIYAPGVTVSGFTIKNSGELDNDDSGITVRSSNNNISGNIFTNNDCGILLFGEPYYSTKNNIISDNIFFNNIDFGLIVDHAHNNIITNNIFKDNGVYGSIVVGANNNIVSNNVFSNDGIWLTEAYQNIFVDNTVNNKPLIYLENQLDTIVNEDAGQVILVDCENITVQNKDLSNTTFGIILERTHDCIMSSNTIQSGKWCGIYLENSNNNNLSLNTISAISNGISLFNSHDNIVSFNTIRFTRQTGLYLVYSENNKLSMNTFSDNYIGLVLTGGSNDNTVNDNIFLENSGAWVYGAWSNIFMNNTYSIRLASCSRTL
jgi:parallel beta-helix repeat protein